MVVSLYLMAIYGGFYLGNVLGSAASDLVGFENGNLMASGLQIPLVGKSYIISNSAYCPSGGYGPDWTSDFLKNGPK